MSKHVVVIMALALVASGAYALPQAAVRTTYATEAELLAAPGSAGYAVDKDLADNANWTDADLPLEPLCEEGEHEGEGEDGAEDGSEGGDENDAEDGGDDGNDAGPGPEGELGVGEGSGDADDEFGC